MFHGGSAAAGHGRVAAGLAGVGLHAGRGAPCHQRADCCRNCSCNMATRPATTGTAPGAFRKSWWASMCRRAPEQIITTIGATHALDIVSRTLLRAGDPVMVEEPGWAIEFARLESLGMRILPVPRRADGPDLEVMAKYCQAGEGHKPKLFVSVSVLHNPTGYSLTPGSAHRVLQLGQPARLPHRRGRHLQPPGAGSRDAAVCARWPLAHHLRERFRQDSGAQLAHRLSGRATCALWSPAGNQAAGHPHDAGPVRAGAGLVYRPGPVAPPQRTHPRPGWTRHAAAPSSWRWRLAAVLPRSRLACSAGSRPASTPMR